MNHPFKTQRRVEFRDTDAAGIVHFSVYSVYMEQAEHEMLRSLGCSVVHKKAGVIHSWPRVSVSCDFRSAVTFGDLVDVEVWVAHIGSKSIRYRFRFSCDSRLVAEGTIVAVHCRVEANHSLVSEPIPTELKDLLSTYLIADPV